LHTKPFYPDQIYRIPTGGIKEDEPVLDSLTRELWEETGFKIKTFYLQAIILYEFRHIMSKSIIPFSSYLFSVRPHSDHPRVMDTSENISGFEWAPPSHLVTVVDNLKNLSPKRWNDWGRMRAPVHEIIAASLNLDS